VNRRHTAGVVDNQTRDAKGHVKSAIVTKHLQDSDQNKVKHFTDHESHAKQTTKNKTDEPSFDFLLQFAMAVFVQHCSYRIINRQILVEEEF
jgi:hypothetical protein